MRYPKLSVVLAATIFAGGALGDAHAAAPAPTSHYTLDPAKSSLEFTFLQAGAKNTGRFPRFAVSLDCAGANPEGGGGAGHGVGGGRAPRAEERTERTRGARQH